MMSCMVVDLVMIVTKDKLGEIGMKVPAHLIEVLMIMVNLILLTVIGSPVLMIVTEIGDHHHVTEIEKIVNVEDMTHMIATVIDENIVAREENIVVKEIGEIMEVEIRWIDMTTIHEEVIHMIIKDVMNMKETNHPLSEKNFHRTHILKVNL